MLSILSSHKHYFLYVGAISSFFAIQKKKFIFLGRRTCLDLYNFIINEFLTTHVA